MGDVQVMQEQFPQTSREMSILCGVCDPSNIINRLTYKRYDAGVIVATIAGGVLTFAPQTLNLFTTGTGERIGGLAAGALKDRSWTNLDPGGAAIDSPCIFTAYGQMLELSGLTIYDDEGNETDDPALYYDQAYNQEVLAKLAKRLELRIEEPNGCRDFLPPLDMFPSEGSSRAIGDQNRSAMFGVLSGNRIAVCYPGQNAKRPFNVVQLEKQLDFDENGANPFPAVPGGSTLGIQVRWTLVGSADVAA